MKRPILAPDLIEIPQPMQGSLRFLHRYLLPEHSLFRRAVYEERLRGASGHDAEALAVRGRLLRLLGDKERARREFEAALRRDARCAAAWAYRGEAALAADPRAALRDLDRACFLAGEVSCIRLWRGFARFLLGEWDLATGELEAASSLDRGMVAPFLVRALLADAKGDAAAALEASDAAIDRDPAAAGLYTLRAGIRAKQGLLSEGIEDAHQAILLHPENLDAFIRVFYAAEGLGKPDPKTEKALLVEILARKVARPDRKAWMFALKAEAEKRAGYSRHEATVEDLSRAVALEPRRAWMRAFLGRALTLPLTDRVKNLKSARREMDTAVSLAPRSGWIRAWRSQVRKDLDDRTGAFNDLERAVALDPDYRLAHAWRGQMHLERGGRRAAIEDLTLALDVRPHHSWTRHLRLNAYRALGRYREMLADCQACATGFSKYSLWAMGFGDPDAERILEAAGVLGLRARQRRAGADPREYLREEELSTAIEEAPRDALAWLWRGRARLNAAEAAAALEDIDHALRLRPDLPLAQVWRGEALLRLNRRAAAERCLRRALALGRKDPFAHAWRSVILAMRGDIAGAFEDLIRAAVCDPVHAAMYYQWGRLLGRIGRDGLGVASRRPQRARDAFAELAFRAKDAGQALAALREPRRASSARSRILRALAEAELGEIQAAEKDFRAAALSEPAATAELLSRFRCELVHLKEGTLAYAALALGLCLRRLKRYREAAEAFTEYLTLRPKEAPGFRMRSEVFRGSRETGRALADLARAARLDPDTEPLLRRAVGKAVRERPRDAWAYGLRGEFRRRAGDLAGALRDAETLLILDADAEQARSFLNMEPAPLRDSPALAWVYAWRGRAAHLKGDSRWAAEDFDRALSLEPGLFWARVWKGEAALALKDAKGAMVESNAALRAYPSYGLAHCILGEALWRQRRFRRALSAFDRALELQPGLAKAWIGRGLSKKELGDMEGSVQDLSRAREIAPLLFEAAETANRPEVAPVRVA